MAQLGQIRWFGDIMYNEPHYLNDIVFDKPKSIIDIFHEYYADTDLEKKLCSMIKPNDKPIMIFHSLRDFRGKDVAILKIEYYNKLYFETWNLSESHFEFIEEIIVNKHNEKRNRNKKNSQQLLKSWGDSWDHMRYSKAKRKKNITDFIMVCKNN